MKKFVLLYVGGTSPSTPEEGQQVMNAWYAWFDKLGDKVVEGGFPFKDHPKTVDSNGNVSDTETTKTGGYSVLQAESIEEVSLLAKDCPHLKQGGSVEIKEEEPLM